MSQENVEVVRAAFEPQLSCEAGDAPRCGAGFQANAGRHYGSLARGER